MAEQRRPNGDPCTPAGIPAIDVGRMLAQATGAEFQGVAEEDLASGLEEFSKYF